ncbi:3-deoxy-7-phosphoheptulonate synthase [Paraconexibacter algicola]|uniref:3-deoxy-7-phosphoheptulonate synthase n=1 Tax=Paraconexibacter algicola TaxID=2133960 RepID=A0A2T4UE66_9ACTN|nr:3-deoxy-7-phosphoheptulonate synthase [Paraconexibacter algicola]PTL55793.1 3-deoxy-7-phosphoheptulonate synthase [Paraconexibacter algicola]
MTHRTTPRTIAGHTVGGDELLLIAGPCTVESRAQLTTAADAVLAAGATMLRGGAYKPRTSPTSFQGLGPEGLELLREARERTGLPIVTECVDPRDVERVAAVADVVQVGARNMQNYTLLTELGRAGMPVVLKRGLSATLAELVSAADYIRNGGSDDVVLCERGIRTFETAYRFTLDILAIPVLKGMTDLPVIVDPSHAAGRRDLVEPLSLAAIAAGADGLIVETHPDPDAAVCDGPQQLHTRDLPAYVARLRDAAAIGGRALTAGSAMVA